MTSIGVVVATFGDIDWRRIANQHAIPSIGLQTSAADQVAIVHAASLHQARNDGAKQLDTDWVIFCDADDELDPGYVAAMRAVTAGCDGDWLIQPSTQGFHPDGTQDPSPALIPPRGPTLLSGNHLVIGTLARTEQVIRVGGFRERPAWEDWELWARCWIDGAQIGVCPDAVYWVGVNAQSRNSLHTHMTPREESDLVRAIKTDLKAYQRERKP